MNKLDKLIKEHLFGKLKDPSASLGKTFLATVPDLDRYFVYEDLPYKMSDLFWIEDKHALPIIKFLLNSQKK